MANAQAQAAHIAHGALVAKAWQDPKVMKDLTSGDQSKIRRHLKSAGIDVPKGVKVHVHHQSDSDVHVVIPPKPKADVRELMSSGGGAHKCYGPFCACGPY